jgi:rhodanese-related sulfurtransferase
MKRHYVRVLQFRGQNGYGPVNLARQIMTESIVNIEVNEAVQEIESGAFILDVREDDEFAAGRIQGAVQIRLSEIPDRLSDIDHARTVVCVCRVGGRSARATFFLAEGGFHVKNLAGGMLAWAEAGLPMESDGDSPSVL